MLGRDPGAEAVCLVQPKYQALARDRVEQLRLADPKLARRIRIIAGDITLPDLGLGSELEEHARQATTVWHLAAVYDLSVALGPAMRVNLDGTRNVLAFASRCDALQRLHYVSTCYVSGRYAGIFGEDDLALGQAFSNHYELTKYHAEVAVRDAMRAGLPATIYRPAIVVGDGRTGETQKYDGPYYVIRWVLRQPRVAIVPVAGDPAVTRVNLVPRDFVVRAIDHLSTLSHSAGRTYQLADPAPLTVAGLLDAIGRATGRRIKRLPVPRRGAKWTLRRVPGARLLTGIPAAAVDYFSHPTHYTTFYARTDLEGSGIEVPPFESYLERLVTYLREHPKVSRSGLA